jgi:hypothetical protein
MNQPSPVEIKEHHQSLVGVIAIQATWSVCPAQPPLTPVMALQTASRAIVVVCIVADAYPLLVPLQTEAPARPGVQIDERVPV